MLTYLKNLNWQQLAKISFILVIFYFILLTVICLFKYFTFSYNGLDLAIFNQVFFNSSLGDLFSLTIHPKSYLADHFTPIILLILPFYSIFPSAITLLFIQTIFVALAVVPLFLIAKKHLSPIQTLFVIILYLFNPATINLNLYEFHLMALVPFFIFWVFYFYQKNDFKWFALLAGLSLLIREDTCFVIFMFGIVALLDKKPLKWILTPIISSGLYFFTAISVISYFSSAHTYKFIVYYSWLGNSIPEIAFNFFTKFHLALLHIFSLQNFNLVLAFLLATLFLPLVRPKYLLLCLGFFLQFVLANTSGFLVFQMHYNATFLSALIIATIFSLKYLKNNPQTFSFYKKYKEAIIVIIVVGLIYNLLILSQLPAFIKYAVNLDFDQVRLKKELTQKIPKTASVIASHNLLTNLSSRKNVYSLHYSFIAQQQFSAGEYKIPQNTEYLITDYEAFNYFHNLFRYKNLKQGDDNLRQLLIANNFKLKKANQYLALWQNSTEPDKTYLYKTHQSLPKIKNHQEMDLTDEIKFLGYSQNNNQLSLFFQAKQNINQDYFLQTNDQILCLGSGFYPTHQWQTDEIIEMNLFEVTPKFLSIISYNGPLYFDNGNRSTVLYDNWQTLAEFEIK